MKPLLVVGNMNQSSWSMRPWIAMQATGIAFDVEVRFFGSPGWHESVREISPSGRVPAFRHGDLVLWESLAICEYLAEAFPEARLWPDERGARAVARAVSAEMHGGFAAMRKELSLDVTARFGPRRFSPAAMRDLARVQEIWSTRRAPTDGPFLFGRFSIADAMYAPVVYRFRAYGVEPTASARPYYEAMLELPAMKAWDDAARAEVAANPTKETSSDELYAVVFSSKLEPKALAEQDYAAVSDAMDVLAAQQPGYRGIQSVRGEDGEGITVSYWASMEALRAWAEHPEHKAVQAQARSSFYERYEVRVCRVERAYDFVRGAERV